MAEKHNAENATLPLDNSVNPPSESSKRWVTLIFNSWALQFAHVASSIALAVAIAFAVNGYNAIDTSTPRYSNGKLLLRVSDVTTLVSMGLVINRFFTASWTAVAIWRCIFILKQNPDQSLNTPQLLFLQKYRLPPWARYPFLVPRGSRSWIVFWILLCILPQQFTAPLISGAVDWNSVSVPGDGQISVNSTNPISSAVYYEQYPSEADTSYAVRQQVLGKAQGLASLAWSDLSTLSANGTSLTGNGCRHVVSNDGLTANATLLNSVVPCIKIENITWATAANQIPDGSADDAFSYARTSLSEVNVSLDLHSATVGQTMLFNPNLLWNPNTAGLPNATVVSGQQTIVVSISSTRSSECSNLPISLFGDVSKMPQYLYRWYYACYVFANVTITAGVTKSSVSKYLSPNVVEDQTPLDQVTFEPSLWVQEALWILPDLMSQLTMANASQTPTWENLDLYVENSIRQAYLGAWDSFHQVFDDTTITPSTISVGIPAVPRIQASVSNARVFSWLAISLLILVAGLLLLAPQVIIRESNEAVTTSAAEGLKDAGKDLMQDMASDAGGLIST